MVNTLVQFRVDESDRTEAMEICSKLGIDLQSYFRICLARLIREKGIPFSMKIEEVKENKGISAMKRASKIAKEYGISDLSLEEINEVIREARG
ncbi:MAG: type II toxin-antitoxin system RelB/DinJ family antitoxin [Lachnospiraceae bacterium]|nr:type II toxin-antitoxin system RelB/DinJ family antitoxin [Lachnospiraceae bacterium]